MSTFNYRLRGLTAGGAGAAGRRRLGARKPPNTCSFVSFAPSPGPFFLRDRRRLGARKPPNPCSFVSFAPSPGPFFLRGRRRLGARKPPNPCSFVSFAPSPRCFSSARGRGGGLRPGPAPAWCTKAPDCTRNPGLSLSSLSYFAVALSTRNCPTFSWKKYSSKLFSFA